MLGQKLNNRIFYNLTKAGELYDKAISSELAVEEVCSSDVLGNISCSFKEEKEKITLPTGKMWVQYMTMVDILRKFLKAERTGNWKLHLETVHEMLPYFAASGHSHYAKYAHIYLQMMLDLPKRHPDVYEKFEGYHVIGRSDRYWAGIFSDLIIE